jgi:hypothetical protein
MGCNRCGRRTPRRLCRDCDREQRQEDRVDVDYGWAVDTDEDTDDSDDEIATDGGFAKLGHALDLVQEAAAPLFTSTTNPVDAHLSLARSGLVDAGWVDGHREERLEEVDHHLAAAAELSDDQDVVVPARNARQLIRAFQGGGVA